MCSNRRLRWICPKILSPTLTNSSEMAQILGSNVELHMLQNLVMKSGLPYHRQPKLKMCGDRSLCMGFIEDYLNSSISTLFGVKLRLILATRLL